MSFSFNLIDEPWIPCLASDGKRQELGIREVLQNAQHLGEILGETPIETAAIHRLLLAILHRVLGPKDAAEWGKLYKNRGFNLADLDAYLQLSGIHDAFDLFGEKYRFYQYRDPRAGEKSVISMVIHAASGNNSTLFDHSTEHVGIALTPAQAVRALLVSQMFGIGGLSGLPDKFTDGPAAKGILFFAKGESLFETLLLNMLRYAEDKPIPTPNNDDLPAWEMTNPFQPARKKPKGYLDYLTWQNRRIWLLPEKVNGRVVVRKMTWAPGLVMEADDIDPMKHYRLSRTSGMQPLCFSSERALWRDSGVLFQIASAETKPPLVVSWLDQLAGRSQIDLTRRYQLVGLGMAKNKASVEFLRAENLPLSLKLLRDTERIGDLSHALVDAENTARAIRRSVFLLALLMLYPDTADDSVNDDGRVDERIAKGQNSKSSDRDAQHAYSLAKSWDVESLFWNKLEQHFHRFIQDLPDTPVQALKTWRNEVRCAAKESFAQAIRYAGEDLRAQRAAALASQTFHRGLAAALGKADHSDLSSQEETENETT